MSHKWIVKSLVLATAFVGAMGLAQAQTQADLAAQMKNELKITSAQESVWNQFVEANTQTFRPSRAATAEQYNRMTTPQRIEYTRQLRAEQQQLVTRRENASLSLYNQLSPAQRKAFDNISEAPVPQK